MTERVTISEKTFRNLLQYRSPRPGPGQGNSHLPQTEGHRHPSLEGEHNRYGHQNRAVSSVQTETEIINSLEALLPDLDALIIVDRADEQDCGVITSVGGRESQSLPESLTVLFSGLIRENV